MTQREWTEVAALVRSFWPTSMTAEQVQAQWVAVQDLDKTAALAAVAVMAREGREFAPNAGAIYHRAMAAADTPLTFDVAWRMIERAIARHGVRESDALRDLYQQDTNVARFVVEVGWDRLRMERADDPDVGGAVLHRLAKEFAEAQQRGRAERAEGRDLRLVARRMQELLEGQKCLRKVDTGELLDRLSKPA